MNNILERLGKYELLYDVGTFANRIDCCMIINVDKILFARSNSSPVICIDRKVCVQGDVNPYFLFFLRKNKEYHTVLCMSIGVFEIKFQFYLTSSCLLFHFYDCIFEYLFQKYSELGTSLEPQS